MSPAFLQKLSPDERAWWLRFLEEDAAGKVKKGDARAIYQDDEQRRDAYQRNNLANRDLLNLATVTGQLASLDAPVDEGGPTLGEVTALEQTEPSNAELLELAESLPDDDPAEPTPLFGGELVFGWAEARGIAPGPFRSRPTQAFRDSLERYCRQLRAPYPFGRDANNNLLGRALKQLGLIGFEEGLRVPGKPRRWVRAYGLAHDADPALLDPRFWAPGAVRARAGDRELLKPGRPPAEKEQPMSKPKPEKKLEPLPPEPTAPAHAECLPLVKSIGVVDKGSRKVVVYLETQGDRVLTREVVSACPENRSIASNTFRRAVMQRLDLF